MGEILENKNIFSDFFLWNSFFNFFSLMNKNFNKFMFSSTSEVISELIITIAQLFTLITFLLYHLLTVVLFLYYFYSNFLFNSKDCSEGDLIHKSNFFFSQRPTQWNTTNKFRDFISWNWINIGKYSIRFLNLFSNKYTKSADLSTKQQTV